jgi:hypothetical protein
MFRAIFARPQEHFFDCIYSFSVHCTKKLYIQSKSAPEDGRICRPKQVGLIKKINKRKSCCILLVAYTVVLMMHGHTNIK